MIILDQEIERLNSEYSHLVDNPTFVVMWKELMERLEILNKDIILKKQNKFSKDRSAFVEGYAYCWSGRKLGRRGLPHVYKTRNPTTAVKSDSSLSSVYSQQSSLRSITTPATQSSRKRSRYGGSTPPANPK